MQGMDIKTAVSTPKPNAADSKDQESFAAQRDLADTLIGDTANYLERGEIEQASGAWSKVLAATFPILHLLSLDDKIQLAQIGAKLIVAPPEQKTQAQTAAPPPLHAVPVPIAAAAALPLHHNSPINTNTYRLLLPQIVVAMGRSQALTTAICAKLDQQISKYRGWGIYSSDANTLKIEVLTTLRAHIIAHPTSHIKSCIHDVAQVYRTNHNHPLAGKKNPWYEVIMEDTILRELFDEIQKIENPNAPAEYVRKLKL